MVTQNLVILPVNVLRHRLKNQANTFITRCLDGGERMVKVWVLNNKKKKELISFLVDGYEPKTNNVYLFHECHWHGHTCLRSRTRKQQKRCKDTWKINWLAENNG